MMILLALYPEEEQSDPSLTCRGFKRLVFSRLKKSLRLRTRFGGVSYEEPREITTDRRYHLLEAESRLDRDSKVRAY